MTEVMLQLVQDIVGFRMLQQMENNYMLHDFSTHTCQRYRVVVCDNMMVIFLVGICPSHSVWLNNSVSGGASSDDNCFSIWLVMSPGPDALDATRRDSNFLTPLSFTVSSSIIENGFLDMVEVLVGSSVVKTELICVLKISAFSALELCRAPSDFNGARPQSPFFGF